MNLSTERLQIAQGYAGLTSSFWAFDLAAEYDISTVNTFAFAIGHVF